jgi:dUTP pyrophosphatase
VIVVLFNHSDVDFKIQPGDRIAQLICEKVILPKVKEVKSLNETERGEDGFGSTGY